MKSQAEVCIHTRQAASAVGATTMDRPEWVAVNPKGKEAYCCLTNNKNRGVKPNAGGDETPVGGPNPRKANQYGQIVRWIPNNGDHTAAGFSWDLFVVAGNPAVYNDAYAGSKNVNKGNMFNSPDGLAFDNNGLLWIQTDGNYSNKTRFAGQGNNQMLVGDPQPERFAVSWSGRSNVKSPASRGVPIAERCSSESSIRAKGEAVTFRAAGTRSRGLRLSPLRRMTAA